MVHTAGWGAPSVVRCLRRDDGLVAAPKPLVYLLPPLPTLALPWIVARLCGPPQSGVAAVNKQLLSDILSVLGMVSGEPGRKCLHYKLSGNVKDLASWGHEYVRHLTGEISEVRCR